MIKMKKKNSPMRKLVAAIALLALSTVSLIGSTYAWFTMNKEVSVTGMKLKATAEEGLVISDYTKDNWAANWTVTMADAAVLAPTSTPAIASPTWVRAASNQLDEAQPVDPQGETYSDLTLTYDNDPITGEGIGSDSRTVTVGANPSDQSSGTVDTNYVLLRKFYIKGTGDTAWAQNLVIDEVSATTSDTAMALDNSVRVLVVVGTNAFIYAPIQDEGSGTTTMSYRWKDTTDVTALAPTTDSVCTSITSIPAANSESPIEVCLYMYFEGEDVNCKSSNASGLTLNDITITAKFKTQDVPAAGGGGGG
jgi:hypothetical protein